MLCSVTHNLLTVIGPQPGALALILTAVLIVPGTRCLPLAFFLVVLHAY
jgi:hypothetical protein